MSTAETLSVVTSGYDITRMAPIPEDLLVKVLEPYSYKGCRYLLDAEYEATETSVSAVGNFSIKEPAYIRDTGHFNAAEWVLCFNQLAYSAFAPAILNEVIPEFRGWSIEDYFNYQLPSMLIKTTKSRFKRPIKSQKFSARLLCRDFEVVDRTIRYLKIPCTVEFWDEDGAPHPAKSNWPRSTSPDLLREQDGYDTPTIDGAGTHRRAGATTSRGDRPPSLRRNQLHPIPGPDGRSGKPGSRSRLPIGRSGDTVCSSSRTMDPRPTCPCWPVRQWARSR